MNTTLTKDFHDCREEVASKWGKNWEQLMHHARNDAMMQDDIHYEVCEVYAKQSCQLTLSKILDEITPFLERLDGDRQHAILNAFLYTDPILP